MPTGLPMLPLKVSIRSRTEVSRGRPRLRLPLTESAVVSQKVIKRMAYGFRDDAYFFLKIRAAFPGLGR